MRLTVVFSLMVVGGACSTLTSPPPTGDDTGDLAGSDGEGEGEDEPEDTFTPPEDTGFFSDTNGSSGSGDPNVDTDLASCTPLNEVLPGFPDPTGPAVTPAEIAMRVLTYTSSSGMSDMTFPDGQAISGYAEFTISNAAGDELCTVLFDTSSATSVTPTQAAPNAWAAWSVPLQVSASRAVTDCSAQGCSTCAPFTAAFADGVGVSTDPRQAIVDLYSPMVLGVGPLTGTHRTDVEQWINGDPSVDFATEIDPYYVAFHAGFAGDSPQPWGIAARFDSQCDRIVTVDPADPSSNFVFEPKPTAAWPGGITTMISTYITTFSP